MAGGEKIPLVHRVVHKGAAVFVKVYDNSLGAACLEFIGNSSGSRVMAVTGSYTYNEYTHRVTSLDGSNKKFCELYCKDVDYGL